MLPSPKTPPSEDRAKTRCLRLARFAGLAVGAVGCGSLVGWALRLPALMSVFPGLVSMKPNTAVGFCLGGASLFLLARFDPSSRPRRLSALLAAVMAAVGAITLVEYLAGFGPAFDELLFKDRWTSLAPGRMAPISAINFACLGLALLLLLQSARRVVAAHALAVATAFTSILTIAGYLYGVESLYKSGRFTAVALHSSVAFLLLSVGVWCAGSDVGLMRVVTSSETSGMLVRRYLPVGLVVPFLIGWLRVQGVRQGWFSEQLAVVLVAMSNATIFVTLVWVGSLSVRAAEQRRARVQRGLRESEERLNLVVEHLTEGLIIWDASGIPLHWNPAALAMHGFSTQQEAKYRRPELTQLLELSALDGRKLPVDQWPLALLLAGYPLNHLELRVRRPDQGWERVFSYDGALVRNTDGQQLAFLTIADVTLQKEAQTRVEEVANAMPQMVWTARPDGFVDYHNDRWYEYTGAERTLLGDASWKEFPHPDDLPLVQRQWTDCVTRAEPFEMEFRLRRQDGEYRWFLSRGEPIKDAEGKVLRWICTNTDVHESKLLREQNAQLLASERAARAEAERTSHMKDEFLATLSHELRTPLNAMLGWTQVLRGDPGNSPEVEDGLATIERNARAQKGIIDDLLDMSSIISGKVRLAVQPLDLAAVVGAAVETVRPAAAGKGIRLQTIIDPQAGQMIGDPNRLQQVFWNLLTNALKFTPKDGQVQVILARVHSHLEVCVIDTGEGIAPEFLPNVFDRFRQADASPSRRHGGLGLGLAIVKQLVELHGGGVHVESPGLGQGTAFRVMLPLRAVQPEDDGPAREDRHGRDEAFAPSVSTAAIRLDGVSALVVDDEADARGLVKRLLEDRGARVRVASSVPEAMELLRAEKPDVLVSDIGMPGEDGYALIRQVRELGHEGGGNVRAVALTAYARAEDRVKVTLAGFQMHATKPVDPAELIAMVASVTGRTPRL